MSFCAASHTAIPNQILDDETKMFKFPKFQVGDFVRVTDKRNIYSKVIQQIGIENFSKYTKLNQLTQ